jgi:hypothetical protein
MRTGKLAFLAMSARLLVAAVAAQAVVVSGYDPRYIDIDGDVLENGSCVPPGTPCIDWLTKQMDGSLAGLTDGVGNADPSIFSPASTYNDGSSLPKQDITRVWLSNNNEFLYLGEERRANNGNSSYHLFLTKVEPTAVFGEPVVYHLTDGDMEIRICFPKGSQPELAAIEVLRVTGLGAGAVADVMAADIWSSGLFAPFPGAVAAFQVNQAPTLALDGALDSHAKVTTEYDTATFAEAAISLAAAGLDPCGSTVFASLITRSSCSLTSDIKDLAPPVVYNFGGPVLGDIVVTGPDCENNVCLAVSVDEGTAPYTLSWYDGATLIREVTLEAAGSDSFCITLDPGIHSIRAVVVDDAGCEESSVAGPITVYELMTVSLSAESNCIGEVTWTASASGGDGSYTYAWTVDGSAVGEDSASYLYQPNADCEEHTVCVVVTDSRGCDADACKQIYQSVDTVVTP